MKTILLSMLVVGGVLVAAPNQNMQTFSNFDVNHDGKITQNEFQIRQQERMKERAKLGYPMKNAGNAPMFGDMDKNKDGFINAQEFRNFQRTKMQNNFNQGNGMGMGPGGGGMGKRR
ncbi:MAG: EF-hand domain-containing protein [Sulfurospirillaceae bacterium]|nr:EF-hand domain-containing protein [Sulfurospirillaceae bacterium]